MVLILESIESVKPETTKSIFALLVKRESHNYLKDMLVGDNTLRTLLTLLPFKDLLLETLMLLDLELKALELVNPLLSEFTLLDLMVNPNNLEVIHSKLKYLVLNPLVKSN